MNLIYFAKRAALLLLIFATFSCNKNSSEIEIPVEERGHFKISFVNNATKAFFDGASTGEACERKLQNAVIFIYENDSESQTGTDPVNILVYAHKFTEYELGIQKEVNGATIDAPTAVISIPEAKFDVTKAYDFYVLANHKLTDDQIFGTSEPKVGMTRTDLEALVYSDVDLYNADTFDEIFPTAEAVAMREVIATGKNGFAMSGSAKKIMPTANENTPRKVDLVISRNVAKVESKAWTTKAFDDNYFKKYGSKLTITSVKLLGVSGECFAIEPATFTDLASEKLVILTQTPKVIADGSEDANKDANADKCGYHNIFYLFENQLLGKTASPSNKVTLQVEANFDFDGESSTEYDISKIVYKKELNGVETSTGVIGRNSYIQLTIKIGGLTSSEVVAGFTIKDWNAVSSQDVEFGS